MYNISTFMQNAIVYADETNNTYMLEKLVTLVMLPLQSKYITREKWLHNGMKSKSKHIGKEIELCISKYFVLLTRTLSSAERHNIPIVISDHQLKIIEDHIDKWIQRGFKTNRVVDRHLYFVQSILQFYNYMILRKKIIKNLKYWKIYAQSYMQNVINKKWEQVPCSYENKDYFCLALDRDGWVNHPDFRYAGFGKEFKNITDTIENTNQSNMFDINGIVKVDYTKNRLKKVAQDISHARRYNFFFETLLRFGFPFKISISSHTLEGWANNLAYRVCQGTIKDPYFTIFSDGTDGWYRVNYSKRKSFGYAPGEMDIHFIGSSYGMMGIYNSKIYRWVKAWVKKYNLHGQHGGYALAYYTSLDINLKYQAKTSYLRKKKIVTGNTKNK